MAHFDTSGLQPAADRLPADGMDVVRLGYADLIGTDRGRDLLVSRFARTAGSGVAFCRSVYGTTPRGGVVDMEGGMSAGLPDLVAFPDVGTLLPSRGSPASHTASQISSTLMARLHRRARGWCCGTW